MHGQYEIKLIAFFVAKDGEAISKNSKNNQQKQDLDLTVAQIDHQLLIAKFRLKPKKAGKITRPARYDLIQIPYEYAVEVMNRFKGLELINSVPEELWMEVCNNVWEAANKTILNKKTNKKAKWLSEVALQIAKERKEMKSKGERKRYIQPNADFQRLAQRDKKTFINEQCMKL